MVSFSGHTYEHSKIYKKNIKCFFDNKEIVSKHKKPNCNLDASSKQSQNVKIENNVAGTTLKEYIFSTLSERKDQNVSWL